ncbi:MAG: hypothetical protein D4R64_00695 [Porphyromonadaceae bacterium]|nr:MAG: hypothetical protein D4R64_00695 [Porphyromonadaceae bacterium]
MYIFDIIAGFCCFGKSFAILFCKYYSKSNAMKNYLILAMILIAGMTAYPQATKTARETKTEKGSAKKEAAQHQKVTRSESRSNSEKKVKSTNPERTRTVNPPTSVERSKSTTTRPETTRSRVETKSTNRTQATRDANETTRRNQEQSRVKTNIDQRNQSGNAQRRQQTTVTRPQNKSGSGTVSPRTIGESRVSGQGDVKVNSSSASRVYREGKGTLTRDDGTVIRHQNDEVFASRKYNLNYDNYESLRRSDEFQRDYRDYDNWYQCRYIRVNNHYHNRYIPISFEVRRSRYYFRQPHHYDLIWTPLLFHRFMFYYPTQRNWDMEFGSQIETISAYDAQNYAGTVRRVYGKVDEVYYSPEDENYILYIGAPFPYQDISIVVPKNIARNVSMNPKWYFQNEYVWVIGLINMWEGKPEIIVRDEDQIRKY